MDALHTELVQCIIRGQESDEGAKMLAQKMDTGLSQARRLIYTECAAAASAAQKDCFKELGVEEFQVVATLDSHTSRICRDMMVNISQWQTTSQGLQHLHSTVTAGVPHALILMMNLHKGKNVQSVGKMVRHIMCLRT